MTAYIIPQNRTYQEHEFVIQNDLLHVCGEKSHDPVLQYITMVGLSLSIIFLTVHLSVFIATLKLRNLSSMNLASLCLSLLFLYATFIISGFQKPRSTSCVVIAVLIHYSLTASFCWMLVIAFDIWRVVRQTTTRLRVLSGRKL